MRSARGITFLETVLAVALLGLTTMSVVLAVNYISAASIRNAHRLNAAEIGNRLLLQYFDDPNSLPSESAPVQYGKDGEFRYRWTLGEEAVTVELPTPLVSNAEEDKREAQLASLGRSSQDKFSRFRVVRVRVWLGEDTGGSMYPGPGIPQVTLTRIYDPADVPNWNPDKLRRQIDGGGLKGVLGQMTGAGGGTLRPSISQQDANNRSNTNKGGGGGLGGGGTRR
ncbi:MAG: hypothetical protein U0573_01685 [Phycisphaerales bacterium]|nr:hypothetical protein [Planctomycetota bacterium]